MKPVGSSVGSFGSGLTGLESRSAAKKKAHIKSIYIRGPSYKKLKKPDIAGIIVDSSAGPFSSHGSKVESEDTSVSGVSDVENIDNMMTKKTSYIDFNTSETDNIVDDTTPRKIDDNAELVLPNSKFAGSNWLLLTKSCALERHSFKPIKSFVLDVNLTVVPGITNSNKLISVKKIFYKIDGFRGASTPSKFFGIIRSSFMSELSLKKAKELAIREKIVVNDDIKQVNKCMNQEVIVKKIPVNFLKSAIESVFSKFGEVVSVRMQLIGLWQKALVEFKSIDVASLVASKWSVFMEKDLVHVALAVNNKVSWILRDQHQALLYTLPVSTTAHNLSGLLESYGGRTCFIGCNLNSYVHNRCAVICFKNEASKLAAIGSVPVYKSVNLCWTGLFLACCTKCKQLDHISTNQVCLANIYKKKQVPIIRPVSFNEKTWTQVTGSSFSHVVLSGLFGTGSFSDAKSVLLVSNFLGNSCLLLMDQVSVIIKKLSFMELVPLVSDSHVSFLVVLAPVVSNLDSEMALDNTLASPPSSLSIVVADLVANLSSSCSKVLTTKMGELESKMVALEMSIKSVLERLNHLCSGLGSFTSFSLQ
ncbi:hypothetical protein G9A89_023930 [Geosiphon pyriformis]|nr:hypothetical protein G9A89_023930 [Geosiphon pyriformis]